MTLLNRRSLALLGAAVLLGAPLVAAALDGTSNAANKTSAAGSTIEVLNSALPQTVLATSIKTSAPQDLIFSLTMECALWTSTTTVGNDAAESLARITAWILVDGQPVPISGSGDDGKVVFCDRVQGTETSGFDDEDATITNYLTTRTANAFNWILPDLGSGVHTIEAVVAFETTTVGDAFADAAVGHRTLIVEPTQLAQGFTL